MDLKQQIVFGPFRFDYTTDRLWQGQREIRLRAKSLAVLRYLLEHAGRIISREEFAQHVWVGSHVSQGVLRVCIWELRQALGESGVTPQYIETVGQQGYRFRAEAHRPTATSLDAPFVGRHAELAALYTALEQAREGQLQLVFITGDPGIGKTALVRQFLSRASATPPLWVGAGQCVEHFGTGEAYLPLFEVLERLGREPDSEQLLAVLRHIAPVWLAHLPTLVALDDLERLQHQVQGMGAERMLRQLVEALAVMTRDTVLVLVLEDLQWSDTSTVEFLTYIARHAEHLRLLVIGTYRPAELIARSHPLRQIVQELVVHQMCQVLRLEFFNVEEVQAYMAQRLGMPPTLSALGAFVHQRTEGNALFMVHILDHLIQQGWLVEVGGRWHFRDDMADVAGTVPENLRPLLVRQIEALNADEQRSLDIASVIGFHFTAAEVAAILQCPVEAVEDICDGLAQRESFIEARGAMRWPKGTATVQYAFRHMLYRDVLYARLGMSQRRRLHVLVGEHLEARYGTRTREIAGELATHFERGQDVWRAVQYQQYAAEQALRRHAYPEAWAHGNRGLELLATLPESPEGIIRELSLRLSLSIALTATQGYTSEALANNLQRALALCDTVEATTQLVPLLVGLTRLFMMRSDRAATERLMARHRVLLTQLQDDTSLVLLHTQLGTAETYRAAYTQAEVHQTHALHLYDPEKHRTLALRSSLDPAVVALAACGWRLWLTGWPDQAAEQAARALAHAETLESPLSLAIALFTVVKVQQGRGEFSAALEAAQRLRTLGHEQSFRQYEVLGMMTQGNLLVQGDELASGLTLLTTGLSQYRHLGSQVSLSFFLSLLAEIHLRCGQIEEGLAVIGEAVQLTETNFDRFWAPEVYRLRGDLLLAQAGQASLHTELEALQAEVCFQQALDMARQQGAKALELRAAMSLSRLWLVQGKPDAGQVLLAKCYRWFSEGFETVDLQAAKCLLVRCCNEV